MLKLYETKDWTVAMSEDDRLDRTTAAHATAPSAKEHADLAQLEMVEAARSALSEPGQYLIFHDAETVRVVALVGDWTRIGRSTAADVRFDDPTVSRRHALIIREGDELKLVDDNSLNGIFIGGERVERYTLIDGDSFLVGRYRMSFASVTSDAAVEGSPPQDSLPV